jgi:hypothetical protein
MSNKELIAEARGIGNWALHETGPEGAGKTGPTLFARLVYALEAAESPSTPVAGEPEWEAIVGAWGTAPDGTPVHLPSFSAGRDVNAEKLARIAAIYVAAMDNSTEEFDDPTGALDEIWEVLDV